MHASLKIAFLTSFFFSVIMIKALIGFLRWTAGRSKVRLYKGEAHCPECRGTGTKLYTTGYVDGWVGGSSARATIEKYGDCNFCQGFGKLPSTLVPTVDRYGMIAISLLVIAVFLLFSHPFWSIILLLVSRRYKNKSFCKFQNVIGTVFKTLFLATLWIALVDGILGSVISDTQKN
ncbi:hypothetical protein [Thermoflavimicrobium dichotomicum]|uniref:Uncharacterized protein n=1 Tax=Thermoflavimicrobium dichotomicum TaxID=46223 RepID=A0A1I3UL97_9BACL|nr:hypothetical protein [Thermoflavimicrobium dichotomicum]SFJ84264.1 hypothetical protein SAMN05421852_12613 [Thermoflavimicrobium dichotomicum]